MQHFKNKNLSSWQWFMVLWLFGVLALAVVAGGLRLLMSWAY